MKLAKERALRQHICTRKVALGRRAAMALAASARAGGDAMAAYRCPFEPEHWHVGHAPTMETLEAVAEILRERRCPSPLVDA